MAYYGSATMVWTAAYDDCVAKAPAGYRGRLAFADNQELYDILRGLKSEDGAFIGLRTIGDSQTEKTLILSEWAWHEGATAVQPLTYVPPAGESVDMSASVYMKIHMSGNYEDEKATSTSRYFCEFLRASTLTHFP